jgi:hypothetical protein
MSTSRRALLFILGATVAFAATIGIAFAKGGGKGGKHDSALSSVISPVVRTSPVPEAKAFKNFKVKACNRDYKWLCPTTPIGKVQKNGP